VNKCIKLTDEQTEKLRLCYDENSAICTILGEAVVAASMQYAKNRVGFWNEVARLAGYDSMKAMELAGHRPLIHWISGEIEVRPIPEQAPQTTES